MEIKSIRSISGNSRAKSVTGIIKNTEKLLDSNISQFVEGTPMECNYYSINKEVSTSGVGFNDNAGYYHGAVKYNLIRNFIIYGYSEEINGEKEKNEHLDDQVRIDNISALVLPNTIQCVEEDRFTLAITNHEIIYRVVSVNMGTFHNKPFTKIEYVIDQELPPYIKNGESIKKAGLVINEYYFQFENVGTDLSMFLKKDTLDLMNQLNKRKEELLDDYNAYFYHEYSNTFLNEVTPNTKYEYIVPLVDLQMEFFPLTVYGNVEAILHHETIVDGRRNAVNWNTSSIKKLIMRKSDKALKEGVSLYPYIYNNNMADPRNNVASYFNNPLITYSILDYKPFVEGYPATVINCPDEFRGIVENYYNDTLTIETVVNSIDDFYLDLSTEYLLWTPIVLCIIDIFLYNYLYVNKIDKFY